MARGYYPCITIVFIIQQPAKHIMYIFGYTADWFNRKVRMIAQNHNNYN